MSVIYYKHFLKHKLITSRRKLKTVNHLTYRLTDRERLTVCYYSTLAILVSQQLCNSNLLVSIFLDNLSLFSWFAKMA